MLMVGSLVAGEGLDATLLVQVPVTMGQSR